MSDDWAERQTRKLFAILRHADIASRDDRLKLFSSLLYRDVGSTSELSEVELRAIVDILDRWNRGGELKTRCAVLIARKGEM